MGLDLFLIYKKGFKTSSFHGLSRDFSNFIGGPDAYINSEFDQIQTLSGLDIEFLRAEEWLETTEIIPILKSLRSFLSDKNISLEKKLELNFDWGEYFKHNKNSSVSLISDIELFIVSLEDNKEKGFEKFKFGVG